MSAINVYEKRYFTGNVFFTPNGGQTVELADLSSVEYIPDVQRIETVSPGKGIIYKDVALARLVGQRFEVVANRMNEQTLKIILGTSALVDQVQNAATSQTASFTNVYKGMPLIFGREKLSSVSLAKGATPLVANVDYKLDADTGVARLLRSATAFVDGDTIQATYSCAAVTRKRIASQTSINLYGRAKILLFDTGSGQARFQIDTDVQLMCDDTLALMGSSNEVTQKFKLQPLEIPVNWDYLLDT